MPYDSDLGLDFSTGCGPAQLIAAIGRVVAAQIDPAKLKRGDATGSISCVMKGFEY